VAEIAAASFQNAATLNRLAQQSVSDGLTDLPNKRYFSRRLEETVNKCKRYKMKYVVGMLDIDHFKSINDRYGHVFGDYILRSCAQIIQQTLRNADLIARYGGEEFGIIMPYTDLDGALKLMERVRRLVEGKVFEGEGESCRITVSIGIAAGQPQLGATEIVKLADRALYVAKKNGRNQVVCNELHNKH
jgi:diguanylate cyclase (GGDEF)-like protein